MSDTERKIADTRGQYLLAVQGGQRLTDADWRDCRVVLTNQRIALIADEKRQIPLSGIDRIADRFDVNQESASVADYLAFHVGEDVLLVSAADQDSFETDLYRAALDEAVIFVRHPAIEGGVVQDTEWTKGRVKVTDRALRLALADGQAVTVERADIGSLAVEERTVSGAERTVVEVEHSEDGVSVETHLAGEGFHATVLEVMLAESAERNRADLDLSNTEQRVIMALHSGVSPFDVPEFVGIDVDRTEEIFDRLIELDAISVVRERTEVQLTSKGRSVAGQSVGER
ncbi:CheF family chemotaxis protein [Halomicrobium urmianum]|uniref:CheF family chemotaxis protein n=1 Tax=Halomicrobium urmianum TaxID=1586233 RepID=UPI001CD99FFC|nr:CheF family chemotaxis protein [Halomicrobium urmianum]